MVVTVCMKSVINADLITSPISEANTFPRVHPSVQDQVLSLHLQKLHARDHDFIIEEIGRRELLNANKDIDGEWSVGTAEDDDEEMEDDSSTSSSDDE